MEYSPLLTGLTSTNFDVYKIRVTHDEKEQISITTHTLALRVDTVTMVNEVKPTAYTNSYRSTFLNVSPDVGTTFSIRVTSLNPQPFTVHETHEYSPTIFTF